jgi:N-dimethylarginine dimethylaminohydrolase
MCPPTYFAVTYSINPWMDPSQPVDADRARRQWETLRRTYLELGHRVELIEPVPGLPDMVFAANGGLVVDGVVVTSRFVHRERRAEADAYASWFAAAGYTRIHRPSFFNEGEGDFLLVGDRLLAGTGFRTDVRAHAEVAALLGRPVVTLELVDPRFYHLDTALCALDAGNVAYHPDAFSPAGRRVLERLFPDAIPVGAEDAAVFGANAVSDGRRVVLPAAAKQFATRLSAAGFEPIGVDMDEFRRAGGAVRCCTLELRDQRRGSGGNRGGSAPRCGPPQGSGPRPGRRRRRSRG